MTGVKISTLPVADAANDTDQLEVNQAGTSRRVTVGQIKAVSLGPHTDTADVAITGYITIVDADGIPRKLAIIA